jgi:ATP-dependent DNA helicase RecG
MISNSAYPPYHPRSTEPSPFALSTTEFGEAFPRESELVEFKSGIGAKAIQEAVTAFSNTEGGVLIIGVDDDGVITGRELTQSAEEAINQAIAEIRNSGQYAIHRVLVDDRPVIVVSVASRVEGFAQTSSGRILVRRGPSNIALFDSDLLQFVSRRALDRFELRNSGSPRDDADEAALKELRAAFDWQSDDIDERLAEQQLLTEDRSLTIAGALHLLRDPAERLGKPFIEVLRFPDSEGDYDKRIEIRGPLSSQVRHATQAVLDELGTELVVLGVQRHELPRLPSVVLREAIANAVAHRSYEANRSAVRIEIRPGAVVVVSPGPFPIPVTEDNIRDAQAPRNLAVIRVLRRLGLAEDAGRGVDVMQDSMRAELLEPPTFHDTGHSVEVTLPVRSTVTARERAWIREVERRGETRPSDRIILVYAARGESLTNRRVREITGLDRIEATRSLQRLTRAGFLRQSGKRGGASYTLEGSLAPPAGLRLTPEEIKTTIVEMAQLRPVTNAAVRAQLGLDRAEALRLLDALVGEGRLDRRGRRRGSHYVLPQR